MKSSTVRLDPKLVEMASEEAKISRRSAPKQIEYWAELGRQVEKYIDYNDLVAVTQGLARLDIKRTQSSPIDPADVLEALEQDRNADRLAEQVTSGTVRYQKSAAHDGYIERINADGTCEVGHFENGMFHPADSTAGD